MGTVETKTHKYKYLWLLSIYDILVHKQNKYVKNNLASSFCVVMKKAESVRTQSTQHNILQEKTLSSTCGRALYWANSESSCFSLLM